MHYVYILKSERDPTKFYIGETDNIERRLKEHANTKKSQYTFRYLPWILETHVSFNNKLVAKKFEAYLKTGSGRSFIKKHLI